MNKIVAYCLIIIIASSSIYSQENNPVPFTTAEKRLESFKHRLELQENSLLGNVELKSIGPTVMSGRVVDIDVSPYDPTHFYVAYASGGLWKTTNNGISFKPIFDNEASMTIGDIAVDWKNSTVYVGTGENNSSRSSYAGTGIYKSTNDGIDWQHLGLTETHRTGRIIIDPNNPERIWVAALGHLYSPNPDRGIYKSSDGGKTWKLTLYIDDNTGAIDMVINPQNTDILYAALWYRTRKAWDFEESGSTSGIYKSTDGGDSWQLITKSESGFPTGDGVGRIGLAINPSNPNILYALLDNQYRREKKEDKEKYAVTKELLRSISKEDFLKLNEDDLNDFLDRNDFPDKYSAKLILEMVEGGKIEPIALVDYLEDANSLLFDTEVIGAEVYRSNDGGIMWNKTHKDYLDDVLFTYGYYFGEVRVSPNNPDKIYILGVPILKSEDGGKTFSSINEENVHVDHHALWISPTRDGHLILGNDGGINITYDGGESWFKANTPPVGQFYTVAVDMEKPYNVYGGLQDNGVWFGPSNYVFDFDWYASGHYPYRSLMGGDGMQIAVDTRNNNIVYTGYQFGNYFRIDKAKRDYERITPRHDLGERPYRFNWQTPIHLSVHNQDILYMGSNKLHRSLDGGKTFVTLSGDLTKGGKKGDVPFGTLTTIDESPLKFGLLYAGSDDGLVHISKDAGYSWQRISNNLPQDLWVSRVETSHHDTGTVYVSLNGYRWDNFDAILYSSTNYGDSWIKLGLDLPKEPINVVKEDPKNENILYVGTDNGLYVSLDKGNTFMVLYKNLPAAPVHDIVIHPRDKDLIVGTHGRSIYIANVEHIQKLNTEVLNKQLHLFDIDAITFNKNWGNKSYRWSDLKTPEVEIVYYVNTRGNAIIKITTEDGLLLKRIEDDSEKGLNFVKYDLTIDSTIKEDYFDFLKEKTEENKDLKKLTVSDSQQVYLHPAMYKVEVEINGVVENIKLEIKAPKKKKRGSEEE